MLMPVQIAKFDCRKAIALPPFAALRHLILSTASSADLPMASLKNAVALETLSLGISGTYADWSHKDMDVSALHALKHVRLENFAPRKLHVPDGCLLHVVWDGESTDGSKFARWARVQSLWQAQPNRLGSLNVSCWGGELNMTALKSMLTGDHELDYISIWIPELGNEQEPLLVDPNSCQMLALAERVRFRSSKVCSIRVVDMQPKWKDLSIDAARVQLEVEDTAALVLSLDNFWIEGITTHGLSILRLIHELHQSDRNCTVSTQVWSGEEATSSPPGFSFGTLLDEAANREFEELMCCGCSSCLACLSRGAKLSRDSQQPENYWVLPRYSL